MKIRPIFNAAHPTYTDRERGWKPEPNPFNPHGAVRTRYFVDKHIFIYAEQLLYLVDTTTQMLSKARRSEGSDSETIATSEVDRERPIFLSWFDKYYRKVEALLAPYVVKKVRISNDNALREWKEKELCLRMPDYWDESAYDSLVESINRYISDGALLEYFKIRMSSKDPITVDKATDVDDDETDILSFANQVKHGSIQKVLKPF